MQCPRCQQQNPPEAKFCLECGARLARGCPRCGTEPPPGAKFCPECGERLAADAPEAARFPSPEAYTPRHLAEKILTSKSALEGERKQVTVLFADLKGSMELLADRDPEEARRLLDPVLERLLEAVHRYEGTVNQVMGDGIMALFGAPLAHEDHAVRACYAALDMQAAIRRYAEEVRRSQGATVQIRVGLNSGEVVVRSIGSDLHMDYTAVGQTTHLAGRMEQLATPGTTLLTADTLRLVEGYVEVKPLGPVPVKGLEARVEVYELLRAGPRRSRLHAAAARGLTRFVGRDTELEQLWRVLGRAGAGQGQVVAIAGEAGVGKSRLVWEMTHSYRTHGWLILQAGSVSYGKATAYLPVIDLLKAYFQIDDGDDPRRVREKATGKVLTLDAVFKPALPAFLSLLDVPVEDAEWQALDPPERRRRTLEAVKRLLLRESQVQPLLVILEDLHWIDSETQALLDILVEGVPTARLLLLVNHRPEYEHGWGRKTYSTQLRLDPLPPESAGELLQALLGDDPGLDGLKRLLIERTQGNPFFLEESVRTLVETQVLAGDRGAYRLIKPLAAIQVPPTVQSVLAARIDRLPPQEKALLQTAAVIGKDVPFGLLRAIADRPDEELRQAVANLQAAEFLYETSLFPELEFTFKHALTHEVAYGSLLQERRRALHARILKAIEDLYADRLAEHVERLAHHAGRGGEWEKAVAYLRQAGVKAAARSAHREAVTYFEEALEALGHLPESRNTQELAIDLRFNLRSSLLPLGEHPRIFAHLREAETLAEVLGDQPRLGRVYSYLTQYFWLTGDQERAVTSGERAFALATALGDSALRLVTNYYLGLAYHSAGDYRRAADALRLSVNSLQGGHLHERFGMAGLLSVYCCGWLAWGLAELGEFAEAVARGEEAVRIAEAVDQPFSLIQAYLGLGGVYLRQGKLDKAIPVLERGRDLSQAAHIPLLLPRAVACVGYAYVLSGRVVEALSLLEQGIEQSASMRLPMFHSLFLVWLGEGYLLAGRIDEAAELALRALAHSRDHRERGTQAWALRLLGEIHSHHRAQEDMRTAENAYHDALDLAGELGMRPLIAHCHLGLGGLYGRKGTPERARSELAVAAGLFRSMEMEFWLNRTHAALGSAG